MPQCVHQLVEYQAACRAVQPAVLHRGAELSYAELNARANRLARRLRRLGVGRESRVLVSLPRSADLVVALLAVLKTGGSYVPVDPTYPPERRDFIIADSRPAAVITSVQCLPCSPAVPGVVMDGNLFADEPAGNLEVASHPLSPAYIIYTSGSTGAPKGVTVDHESVVALVTAEPSLRVGPGDVVAQLVPAAFDVSVFEIWAALCHGAQVAVLGEDHWSAREFGDQLRRCRPDWLFLTAGVFHLLAEFDPESLASVATLLVGGDVVSSRHLRTAAARCRHRTFAAYGPTETTVFTSLHPAAPGDPAERVPIGTALSGKTMTVLGPALDPLAPGQTGEIYIGGHGVAQGYYGKPSLTAERFLPDPHAGRPGARMYRSGDLGVTLPDGELEFSGRVDRQVKIRGYRIELGEVESVLNAHPRVVSAAVVASEGSAGMKRLVAYVGGTGLDRAAIRGWLAARLPAHMVPSAVIVLDRMPLDPNGKVDRGSLPEPPRSLGVEALADEELEQLIAAVWAEALELDRVGAADNWFEVGGDSLRSMIVLDRLRGAGVEVSADDFLANPTVGKLAALICARPPVPSPAVMD